MKALIEFETKRFNFLLWVFFGVGSLINCIVMMNILIAIIRNSFERVERSATITDNKAKIDLILEVYGFMVWNW